MSDDDDVVPEGCAGDTFYSGICGHGTRGCNINHAVVDGVDPMFYAGWCAAFSALCGEGPGKVEEAWAQRAEKDS